MVLISVSMIMILLLRHRDGVIIQWIMSRLTVSHTKKFIQNGNDRRTNGMGNLKYGMGNFRNDIYGDYIRYTHASCHSYVVMDIGGKILVVNGADESETKKIYDTLREKCQMN